MSDDRGDSRHISAQAPRHRENLEENLCASVPQCVISGASQRSGSFATGCYTMNNPLRWIGPSGRPPSFPGRAHRSAANLFDGPVVVGVDEVRAVSFERGDSLFALAGLLDGHFDDVMTLACFLLVP
jgi:hypothetical protein